MGIMGWSFLSPSKGLIYFNTKLKIVERRHQRIKEVKAKHELLKEELEETKGRLMLDPSKWKGECKYFSVEEGKGS